MGKLYPKTQVHILELDKMFTATQTEDPDIFICEDITLPPNTGESDMIYTLEVYTNDKATGVTTTVTVYSSANEFYEALSISSNPPSTPSAGGPITLTIRFKVVPDDPDNPGGKCPCIEEGLDGGSF